MIFYFVYKLGVLIVLFFPLKLAYCIGVLLSDLHYIFANKDRENVAANLRAIFPEKSCSEIKRIRLQMFRNFAKYLVDFLRFPLLNKKNAKKIVGLKNRHYLDEALSKGKGAIILTAHIGSWELAGAGVALSGYSIGAVALPHRHKSVDNFFNSQRKKKGMIVLHVGNAARECLKLLRQNKIIALLGDRIFNGNGILVDFLGKPTYLPKGPASFSLKTGAVIVPAFAERESWNISKLVFQKPIEFTPSGDKEKDTTQLLLKCKSIIEDYIRKNPTRWFMFRKFWLED